MKVYYKQLIEGCGNPSCRHPLCAGTSESAQRTERSRITEESAKFLAAGLERMAHNYSCENLYSSILELKTEDSLETFTASDPEAQRETWTCPVATTNSVKEDPFINRLKQMVLNLHQYDGSPHYPRASSDSHVFGRYGNILRVTFMQKRYSKLEIPLQRLNQKYRGFIR